MKSCALAATAAATISSSLASRRPYRMFSRTVPPNSVASCATSPIWPRRLSTVTSRMSMPSTRIVPAVTSHRRGISPTSVVLPEPDGPTRARVSPAGTVSDTSRTTGRPGRYSNDTASSSIRPATRPQRSRVGRIEDRRPGVDDLEHALDGPGPLAELPVQARDRAEARPDGDAVQQEPGQRPDAERPVDHLVPRVPEQRGDGAEPEEAHQRPEPRPPERQPRAGGHHGAQVRVVPVELPFLAHVALHDADPRERLLRGRRAAGDRVLDLGADPLERSTEDDRHRDQRRRQQQDDEQQRRAQREQDHDGADQPDDRRQQARDGLGQHRAHERHVVRQARDELADAPAGMEVERQGDQPPEELAAQLGDDPLPHHAQQVRLHEPTHRLDAEQPDEHHDQPVEPARVATRDHFGRDARDDQGERQADRRRDHETDQGDGEWAPVRSEVAEQPAPRHAAEAADLANDGPSVRRDPRELLGHARDDVTRRRHPPWPRSDRLLQQTYCIVTGRP